jgi:hypothetical protein
MSSDGDWDKRDSHAPASTAAIARALKSGSENPHDGLDCLGIFRQLGPGLFSTCRRSGHLPARIAVDHGKAGNQRLTTPVGDSRMKPTFLNQIHFAAIAARLIERSRLKWSGEEPGSIK